MSAPHTVIVDVTAGRENGALALQAAAAATLDLDQDVVVVGPHRRVADALAEIAHDAERLRVVDAPDAFPDDALSQTIMDVAPRSAIPVGISLASSASHYSFVTAGQPKAVAAVAARQLKRLPNVHRSALCAVVPTMRSRGAHDDPFALLLDVGVSADASAEALLAFAHMGAAYSGLVSKVERPRVALLSHTRNPRVAPPPVQTAHDRLSSGDTSFEYVGLTLADQVLRGDADVFVTAGFAGNVVMRTLEGVAETAEALLQRAQTKLRWRVGMSMLAGGVQHLRAVGDWENYGGAPVLGFDRTLIVTHEEAGLHAFMNAIRLAAKVERLDVRGAIAASPAVW